MRGRRFVAGVLGVTAMMFGAACSASPEPSPAKRDADGRRIVGSWGPGADPRTDGYFVANGDVWVIGSCTGDGEMRLTLFDLPRRTMSEEEPFACGARTKSYLIRAGLPDDWRGAVGWQTSGTVTSWHIDVVEHSVIKDPSPDPFKPWRLKYVAVLVLLTAVGVSISAGYLQVSLQYSRIPLFRRESFLGQIKDGQAFWLQNPVLLVASEVMQYVLLGFLWWLAISVGVDWRW